jgi:hypothetical protein
VNIRGFVGWCALLSVLAIFAEAQTYNEAQFKGMEWRNIGPYRGGRVLAVAVIPGNSLTYYYRWRCGRCMAHYRWRPQLAADFLARVWLPCGLLVIVFR